MRFISRLPSKPMSVPFGTNLRIIRFIFSLLPLSVLPVILLHLQCSRFPYTSAFASQRAAFYISFPVRYCCLLTFSNVAQVFLNAAFTDTNQFWEVFMLKKWTPHSDYLSLLNREIDSLSPHEKTGCSNCIRTVFSNCRSSIWTPCFPSSSLCTRNLVAPPRTNANSSDHSYSWLPARNNLS